MSVEPSTNPPAPEPSQPQQSLCPRSREAVDALVGNGFDVNALAPEHRERCTPLSELLAKLQNQSVPCCCADESVERTLARIAAANQSQRFDLCEADADALELLVAHNWDPRRVPSPVRARAERQAQLLALLDTSAVGASTQVSTDHLVRAAMDRIAADTTSQGKRMRLHEPTAPARRSFRLTDLGAVAALLLVAVSVAWPAFSSVRQKAQQAACFGNLGAIGQAVGSYGLKSNSSLPMASASLAGNTWWNVGKPEQSNSANLFTLVRDGLTKPQQMACCGNAAAKDCRFSDECQDWSNIEQVSYSFQNLFASHRPTLDSPAVFVVLSDRNPAVLRAARGERVIYINENSPNHRGRGQNVLFSDGHSVWMETPVTPGGDNLWLPKSIEDVIANVKNGGKARAQTDPLKGVEEPAASDAFLCP